MFPGAGARVYRNEDGEPLGWDYPSDDDYGSDPYDDYDRAFYDDEVDNGEDYDPSYDEDYNDPTFYMREPHAGLLESM